MGYTYLSFDSKFESKLVDGSKTQTLRFDLAEVPAEGELRDAVLDTGKCIGIIEITSVSQLTVEEAAHTTLSGHRNYSTTGELISDLNQYYHNEIQSDSELTLIEFEFVEYKYC